MAEGNEAEQVSYAIWVLRQNGKLGVILTVDYFDKAVFGGIVDATPIKEERGVRGNIRQLHDFIASIDSDYEMPAEYGR